MIFMDLQMPKMHGYETARSIRALDAPRGRTVPIVAMTASALSEDIKKYLAAGIDDHIGKPLTAEAVFAKLTKYLRN
jgi:CheY-like chemotaxis protein